MPDQISTEIKATKVIDIFMCHLLDKKFVLVAMLLLFFDTCDINTLTAAPIVYHGNFWRIAPSETSLLYKFARFASICQFHDRAHKPNHC